ncbi:hypothetical protein BS329_17035 [Amycolatopsis coloradensis]|uniref:Uncharacterized protein n=1 Tax=Amycolatopsis coloradensis TaxID=76021 RepID=A0A1R0KTW7_9PSEU|nr:hypothetical protein BS329_17035 [Amycolatopsis coloradensis]
MTDVMSGVENAEDSKSETGGRTGRSPLLHHGSEVEADLIAKLRVRPRDRSDCAVPPPQSIFLCVRITFPVVRISDAVLSGRLDEERK